MNNYITIYVTSRMLVDALMEYVDDIANENFDIELSKDEVEIHATKVSNTAELPPENMADFLSDFKKLVNCENVQLSDDILFDIKELSWSSALWDGDIVIETSEFEYDKEDKESHFVYSKGDEEKEHSTDESAIAKSKPKKSVAKKAKRVAPKGSAPQLSGAEAPAELAEKWFDYQDVENLLDCGISVISCCNLRVFERVNQHCEKSSNIRFGNTIPDNYFENISEIHFIDIDEQKLQDRYIAGELFERKTKLLDKYFDISILQNYRKIALEELGNYGREYPHITIFSERVCK